MLIKFNRSHQCIDLYNDVEGTNFELQKEVTEFIVGLKADEKELKSTDKQHKQAEKESEKNHELLRKKEVWNSSYFTVLVSADGTYFASLKDIVQHIDDKLYHIEACAYNGKKKMVSVFDFNKYLPTNKQGRMKKLFISYSKTDLELVNKFIEHLSALKLDGKVATWYCTELTAGSTWHTEIQEHFDEADIICFMISPNFMRTKYIHEHEIARAFKKLEDDRKKGKNPLIVPIILDFCRWKTEKNDLTQFTALPYTAKPVVDFANQNMAWYLVEECLRLAIDNGKQPAGDDYFKDNLPEDVKRLYERIVKGDANSKKPD